MKKLSLRSRIANEFLEIPVDFIDAYMPAAPADYVKVYLYLMRAALDPSILLSVNDMADLFDVTPNKVTQALSYWEAEGLLSLDFSDGELSDITILPYKSASAPAQPVQSVPAEVLSVKPEANVPVSVPRVSAPAVSAPEVTEAAPEPERPYDYSALADDENFSEILSVAEFYLKKPMTPLQRESLGFCYLLFDRDTEIVEYLLEYCIERGHYSFHYIEAVAKGWKEEGLTTLPAIRAASEKRNSTVFSIMNAFGLGNRMPVKDETDYIENWTESFDLPIILEACSRTMSAIHTPSFKYADSILASWKKNGVHDKKDIDALEQKHREQAKKVPEKAEKQSKNAFRNFEGRNTDYNSLIASYYES